MMTDAASPLSLKKWWALLLLFCAAGSLAQDRPFAINSVSLPLIGSTYLDEQPGWTPIPTIIEELKSLGANDVKITVSAGSYDSPLSNLPNASRDLNPPDAQIIDLIRQLKSAGFQITLVPFVNIEFDPNANLLDTVHAQPADFKAWMAAHATVMERWAMLAQQNGVDRFAVYTDADQPLTFQPAYTQGWLDLIARVKAVYKGTVTTLSFADGTVFQGGNTQIDLTDPAITAALDMIGIIWLPKSLTQTDYPTLSQLLAGWRKTPDNVDTVAFLKGIHSRYGKPIWLAGVVFHSFAGDNRRSNDIYDMALTLTESQQEQADEYDSLFSVLAQMNAPWFKGVAVDSWSRFPSGYTATARYLFSPWGENFRGKLAQSVISQWFKGTRRWGGMTAVPSAAGTSTNLSLAVTLTASPIDAGASGNLYVAAILPNGMMYSLSAKGWAPYTSGVLPPHSAVTLGTHTIRILDGTMNVSGLKGTRIVAGYGKTQDDLLQNGKYLFIHTIQ